MTPREPFADICVNCIYASIDKDWNIYCEIYKAGIVPECGKENPNVHWKERVHGAWIQEGERWI